MHFVCERCLSGQMRHAQRGLIEIRQKEGRVCSLMFTVLEFTVKYQIQMST